MVITENLGKARSVHLHSPDLGKPISVPGALPFGAGLRLSKSAAGRGCLRAGGGAGRAAVGQAGASDLTGEGLSGGQDLQPY